MVVMVGTLFYPDGHVDKGIWLGDHLTRLLFSIPEAGPGYQDTDELDTPDLKSRGTTAPKGPLERESHRLIHAAANGDSIRIETLIQTGNVYINVVDKLVGDTQLTWVNRITEYLPRESMLTN